MISKRSSLNLRKLLSLSFLALVAFVSVGLSATRPDYPVYLEKIPNPHDYTLFANSGWDGNWYVGYNSCWIKKLPAIPAGNYQRAYLGAKLGRMKTATDKAKPWDKKAVPGEIWIALSSTAAWKPEQGVRLATTGEIPFEGEPENAIEGAGEAQWFWTEVPVNSLSLHGENFVALWSPTPALTSVSSSPVIAAAWGGKEPDTWMTNAVQGAAPTDPKVSLATSITYFQPAIALKLIPAGPPHPIQVHLVDWKSGTTDRPKPVVTVSIEGESVERVWLEFSKADHWKRVGRATWKAPYILSLEQTDLPTGRVKLRVAAANIWEEIGYSRSFTVEVSPLREKK